MHRRYRTLAVFLCLLSSVARAATYYLSPTGSDSANGTSTSTPWLSPNHALNCGDVILASASTAYDYHNFNSGSWGTVTCPRANNVAWLKCATFDACKISIASSVTTAAAGFRISASFWGVQGWEVTNLSSAGINTGGDFDIAPSTGLPYHHIIWANDVANQSGGAGFGCSADYCAALGNLAYATAQFNTDCESAIDVFQPQQIDNALGTHIYLAGNIAWRTQQPSGCFDGEGGIFDSFGNSQSGGTVFSAQAVMKNNLFLGNGNNGLVIEYNICGDYTSTCPAGVGLAKVYAVNNTTYGNSQGLGSSATMCGEIVAFKTENAFISRNLAVSTSANCSGPLSSGGPTLTNNPYLANYATGTDAITGNWGFNSNGNTLQIVNNLGFTAGLNTYADPQFAAPAIPGAPSCSGTASTIACMATTLANFAVGNTAAAAYGYQAPAANKYDPLYPQWLCSVQLPDGIITTGCATQTSVSVSIL